MSWLWTVGGTVGFGAVTYYLGFNAARTSIKDQLSILGAQRAADLSLLLKILRRELSNWMLRTEPDEYLKLLTEVTREAREIPNLTVEEQKTTLKDIVAIFPTYAEFDTIGTREHVLYADALFDFDEAAQNYRHIAIFETLMKELDTDWKWTRPIGEGDVEHLKGYVAGLKDSRFLKRLQETMSLYWVHRSASDDFDNAWDCGNFTVIRVPHFVESRWGVHLKDTNERGIFSSFTFDDGTQHESYYRAGNDWVEVGSLGLSSLRE